MNEHVYRIREAVRQGQKLCARGGGSKPALSRGANLDLKNMSGITEYTPQEYTFTALSGTPLAEVNERLAAEGQHLPFDPPFAEAGATLGGTVAAGVSGPGRFRYGSVRDFLLGVTFVDGSGALVTGGGKVVKNAAGFDFPKLMVGSLGRFGVLVELTFKVFPSPQSYATLQLNASDFTHADALMQRLARSSLEAWALELLPPTQVRVRFGGSSGALSGRLERVQAFLGQAGEVIIGDAETQLWRDANAFGWVPEGHALVKVALSPRQVQTFERALEPSPAPHRYGVGGNVCYLAWPEGSGPELDALLKRQELSGLALTGRWSQPRLGVQSGGAFLERVTRVFDPHGVFSTDAEVISEEMTDAA